MDNIAENNIEKTLTLAQRVKRVIEIFENSDEKATIKIIAKENDRFPLSNQYACVICEMVRLDPDPTDVTCGDQKCLATLGEKIQDTEELERQKNSLEEKIIKIAQMMGVETQQRDKKGNEEGLRDFDDISDDIFKDLSKVLEIIQSYQPDD